MTRTIPITSRTSATATAGRIVTATASTARATNRSSTTRSCATTRFSTGPTATVSTGTGIVGFTAAGSGTTTATVHTTCSSTAGAWPTAVAGRCTSRTAPVPTRLMVASDRGSGPPKERSLRGGAPTRCRYASAMRCSVAATCVIVAMRAIVVSGVIAATRATGATVRRLRRASPSGAAGAEETTVTVGALFPSGVAAETIVTAGAPFPSGLAAVVEAGGAVGGAPRVRPAVVATAAAGRLRATEGTGAGAGAGAETTATAAEGRAAGRNSKRSLS